MSNTDCIRPCSQFEVVFGEIAMLLSKPEKILLSNELGSLWQIAGLSLECLDFHTEAVLKLKLAF